MGLWTTVDPGIEQRRSDRLRVLLDRAAAPSSDDHTADAERSGETDAAAAVRHRRDHGLRRDDGWPSGGTGTRLPRPASERCGIPSERCSEPWLAVPRDDGDPRQDRGRRTARPAAGHALEPAPVTRPRAAARTRQTAARHRSRNYQHATRDVA